MTLHVVQLTLLLVPVVHGRGKCSPETRCTNSPDEGLSSTSEFLPPTGASPLELAAYKAGMNYSIPGTQQCLYGHVDLEGSSMTLEDTRICPLKDGGMCGLVIDYYVCTCASRERALASHDNTSSWSGFGVFLGFGLFIGFYFLVQCCKNLSSSLCAHPLLESLPITLSLAPACPVPCPALCSAGPASPRVNEPSTPSHGQGAAMGTAAQAATAPSKASSGSGSLCPSPSACPPA